MEKVSNKLNEIQATTTYLKNKYEVIERTVKEVLKTYADIIKASSTDTKGKSYCRNAHLIKTTM